MKKSLALLLAIIIVLMLCACGASSNSTPQANETSNEEAGETAISESTEKEMSSAFDGNLTDYTVEGYTLKVPAIWLNNDGEIRFGEDAQHPEGVITYVTTYPEDLPYEEWVYVANNLALIRESYLNTVFEVFEDYTIVGESELIINDIKMMCEEIETGALDILYYWFVNPERGNIIGFLFAQAKISKNDYSNDFDSIINSISYVGEVEQEGASLDTDVIKNAIDGAVGEGEEIQSVEYDGNNLIVRVDMSGANTSVFSVRDIALSRISSITDNILELGDSIYNSWETITIDFGSVGKAVLDKSMVKDQGYGKFFDFPDSILEPSSNSETNTPAPQSNKDDGLSNKLFITKYESDIVVAAKMALDSFISDYKISLAPQNWTIAKFDETETTVITMTDITYNGQKVKYIYVGTLDIDNKGKVVSAKPHYLEVAGVVLGDDGYCKDVFDKIQSLENKNNG